MTPIKNYEKYTSGMEKSMQDKLFWLDKIPKEEYSSVTDYGCADGTFLKCVREHNSNCFLHGIDIDDKMLQKAKSRNLQNIKFTNEADLTVPLHLQDDVLNLSSVIHEIYSYKSPNQVHAFWNYTNGFKYICIRDMTFIPGVLMNYYPQILPVLDEAEGQRRKEFETIWGSIEDPKNFEHYMLKYRYIENWDREVKENYLPLSYDALSIMAGMLGYEIIYKEIYTLPFLREKIKEDWGFIFTLPTHVKMIWKRKEQ